MAAAMTGRGFIFLAVLAGVLGWWGCAQRPPQLGCGFGWETGWATDTSDPESTTMLPPGWRVSGSSHAEVAIGAEPILIALHVAANPDVPDVVYVNAKGSEEMFGWSRAPRDTSAEEVGSTGIGGERTLPVCGGVCPPSVFLVTREASDVMPSGLGQGLWVGRHVLTARHVVDSMWLDGSRLGINGRFVGADVVMSGSLEEPRDVTIDSLEADLAYRMHDWALLAVDVAAPAACAEIVGGSGRVKRDERLWMIGYEPDVPGGGLTARPLRVVAMVSDESGRAAYCLVNDGVPTTRGWSGSFIGRERAAGWEFVALHSSSMKVKEWHCLIAVRPPHEVVNRVFGSGAGVGE
ncbi:MAG: hypothetical protein KF912_12785 [Phycisphaeraceae bacterium]|nr:hypothetical protein [Phycisphaeraceae bacterium]